MGEKNELLKTERELLNTEQKSNEDLTSKSSNLKNLQNDLDEFLVMLEKLIDEEKITKDLFRNLKEIINRITDAQEKYASSFGKNESIKSDSIKRKERIKNIDQELENWKNLKTNSEKMVLELNDRKEKIEAEIIDNQKNPEKIATIKGQNLQNIENTKKEK